LRIYCIDNIRLYHIDRLWTTRRKTYIGLAPCSLSIRSATNAGKKWKSNSQILWTKRLVRKVKPGYHMTYFVGVSQAWCCVRMPKSRQLIGFTDPEVQLYTRTVFVLQKINKLPTVHITWCNCNRKHSIHSIYAELHLLSYAYPYCLLRLLMS